MPRVLLQAQPTFNLVTTNCNPPGIRLRFGSSAEKIKYETRILMCMSKAIFDKIGRLKSAEINYDSLIQTLADFDCEYFTAKNQLTFLQLVSPNPDVRDASEKADNILSKFEIELRMRKDVFDKLSLADKQFGKKLEAEAKRYLQRLIQNGKRDGLHLPSEARHEIMKIKKRICDLSSKYISNLNDDTTSLQFTKEELRGLPKSFFKDREQTKDGKFVVTLELPDYLPCVKHAVSSTTRYSMEKAFHSVCMEENTKILEKIIQLKHKQANLLGYESYAAFVLEVNIAKTPQVVAQFLSQLSIELQKLGEEELTLFRQYKKEECDASGEPFDGKIHMWDLPYYMTRNEELKYSVDQNKLKEYFPLYVVMKGLLETFENLLSLKFDKISSAPVWHKDVELYSVKDTMSGELLGYFYLDLFPREGKYSEAACFPLQAGCQSPDGSRQVAVCALVANFLKLESEHKPHLLTHTEIKTFVHEFGHVLHCICNKAKFQLFSCCGGDEDFTEAPSQMLENWVWEKNWLQKVSAHYKDGSSIPQHFLDALVRSRKANTGVFNLRQIALSTFDLVIHSKPKVDTAKVFAKCMKRIVGVPATPETNMPAASFVHIMDGYDGQYYGYLWSEVFSADMFYSRFKKEGILNPRVGIEYRRCILEPGAAQDTYEMLKNFLGREPNQNAFLIRKGLKSENPVLKMWRTIVSKVYSPPS